MQFTELFLNPSGGTTAEKKESAAEKKETRGERRRKRRVGNGAGGGCGGGGGTRLAAAMASAVLSRRRVPRFLYVSLPGSPVPISSPIHRLRPFSALEYLYERIGVLYVRTWRNVNSSPACSFSFEAENRMDWFFQMNTAKNTPYSILTTLWSAISG